MFVLCHHDYTSDTSCESLEEAIEVAEREVQPGDLYEVDDLIPPHGGRQVWPEGPGWASVGSKGNEP